MKSCGLSTLVLVVSTTITIYRGHKADTMQVLWCRRLTCHASLRGHTSHCRLLFILFTICNMLFSRQSGYILPQTTTTIPKLESNIWITYRGDLWTRQIIILVRRRMLTSGGQPQRHNHDMSYSVNGPGYSEWSKMVMTGAVCHSITTYLERLIHSAHGWLRWGQC